MKTCLTILLLAVALAAYANAPPADEGQAESTRRGGDSD